MGKKILIIGGTRFFGRLLVRDLVRAGNAVTIATRGNNADDFGDDVSRVRVDRRDRQAMEQAFSCGERYDIVYDQMCYSPLDAAISIAVFHDKVDRYVMSSTIEVYADLQRERPVPFLEDDLDLSSQRVELDYGWHDPELPERYGQGKRQAEALFHQDSTLPFVSVRIGHVLAGPEDFTGRLAHYVKQVKSGERIRHSKGEGQSSFINPIGISDFLRWTAEQTFLGPINASDDGALSALDLYRRVGTIVGVPVASEAIFEPVARSQLSPFDYPVDYLMNTRRAKSLGYQFGRSGFWLDGLIQQHAGDRQMVAG